MSEMTPAELRKRIDDARYLSREYGDPLFVKLTPGEAYALAKCIEALDAAL